MSMPFAPLSSSASVRNLEQIAPRPRASARDALAEIHAAQLTLQAFASMAIERLDDLAGELRSMQRRETVAGPMIEESMLRDPIEQLSAVAAELAALVAEQRQLATNTSRPSKQGNGPSPTTPRQETSS